ncbi:hypothetical protein E2P81_ATG10105 [Venturia nashicola]|uniref:Uncharacterized protein n=1 Tax=Venturia nashicola TaxID=86259 RepID=A0A4Z1NCZ9_9PEZI|nr:hypothetical protein E6O75_ATG10326 [Venturia nashicola]TLD18283.1 hypothetical protein E2P81_ATG10105 [Venturia nashicola]
MSRRCSFSPLDPSLASVLLRSEAEGNIIWQRMEETSASGKLNCTTTQPPSYNPQSPPPPQPPQPPPTSFPS